MPKGVMYEDDKFDKLESDIAKIRGRFRQYISYGSTKGAESCVDEALANALDECRTPRSPGNAIHIEFDERTGFIKVIDNGRGIPTNLLEEIFTSLNMGSNINTSNKATLKAETLGQNGVGSLALCGLAEKIVITSYRGGTENKTKQLTFIEGEKVDEKDFKCPQDKHGLSIEYKPSKIMGKDTRIIWPDIERKLQNLQYLNQKKIKIDSIYYDANGEETHIKYKAAPFVEILSRNDPEKVMSQKYSFTIDSDDVIEELDGENIKRFISMDVAFLYTSEMNPYIDSFSNSNNTVDNGDHLDAAIEALCRVLQTTTKNSMSDREKEKLDIKWDDVKTGLSVAVSLRTNYERLYTGQTKHKVVSPEIKKTILPMLMESLTRFLEKNPSAAKELISIVKMNAKVRREGEKVRTAVVKGNMSSWSAYSMRNFDPCTNKGKEYKELFIIEGDSAKGSLKNARDPKYQALFSIRGVSLNVYKATIDQIVGPKGNKEFTDLIKVMGCNVGSSFDISKLAFDKIIIASDADVDGYFIRSLLLAFFFKLYPELIEQGHIYVAEPPLYRVDDKKDPFVINNNDYINRYQKAASKDYMLGYQNNKTEKIEYLDKKAWKEFLEDTTYYASDILQLVKRYKVNDRLLEMILEEFSRMNVDVTVDNIPRMLSTFNIDKFMNHISGQFVELYYDYNQKLIKGAIDGKSQSIDISDHLVRKAIPLIQIMKKWLPVDGESLILKNNKTSSIGKMSLLEVLKILSKYQPNIVARFKGLGENDEEDIKTTLMDPNTRSLIRVKIEDMRNDAEIFQMLRGGNQQDLLGRKALVKSFRADRTLIDT